MKMDLKNRVKELYTDLNKNGISFYDRIKDSDTSFYIASLGLSYTGVDGMDYLPNIYEFDKIFLEGGGMLTAIGIMGAGYAIKKIIDRRKGTKNKEHNKAEEKDDKSLEIARN